MDNGEHIKTFCFYDKNGIAIDVCDGIRTIGVDLNIYEAKAFAAKLEECIANYEIIDHECQKFLQETKDEHAT